MNYQAEVAQPQRTLGPNVRATLRERLEEQRRTAKEFLDGIEAAIKFMNEHPDFENFHNTLGKIGF